MSVRNVILFVVSAWALLYFFIYYVLYSTTNVLQSSTKEIEIVSDLSSRELKSSETNTKSSLFVTTRDPFISTYCEGLISTYSVSRAMATVIIPFRDGDKQDLLQTVREQHI